MKIYLIEDDIVLREELSIFLKNYGYICESDNDFTNIIDLALQSKADLILLDINLPHQDGYTICREIRKRSDVPIIIVTSRNTDMDELMSMNLGADDFVTKPYNTQILIARIEAILRRKSSVENIKLEYNGIYFFPEKSIVKYGENEIELTKNEKNILSILFRKQGYVVSRNELMEELWQSDEFVDDNTLTVNINRLRKKLSQLGVENIISTRRGQGYIL